MRYIAWRHIHRERNNLTVLRLGEYLDVRTSLSSRDDAAGQVQLSDRHCSWNRWIFTASLLNLIRYPVRFAGDDKESDPKLLSFVRLESRTLFKAEKSISESAPQTNDKNVAILIEFMFICRSSQQVVGNSIDLDWQFYDSSYNSEILIR